MKKRNFKNKLISILIAAVMLIGILPAMAGAAQTNSVAINVADWEGAYSFTPTKQADKLVMQMSEQAFVNETKPWVSYSVYVEEAGTYEIEFKTSPIADGKYTSPATFSVNGTAVEAGLKQSIDVNTNVYTTYANLKAGKNTLRFDITGKKPNAEATGEQGLFHLYYINVNTYTSKTIVDGNNYIVEAGSYESGTHALTEITENIVSGNNAVLSCYNSNVHSTGAVWSDSISLMYNVEVPKKGIYNMTVFGSANEEYWGGCKVVVNGREYTDVSYSGTVAFLDKTGHVRKRNPIALDLKAGVNTFYVKSNVKGSSNGNYGFSLDRIEFTPISGSLLFEGEDATGSVERISGEAADGFSGEAWNRVWGTATTTFTTPADDFDLYITVGADIDAAQHENGKYLGTTAISIDGGDFIPLSGTNMTKISGLTGTAGYCANTAKWQYKPGLTLSEGQHSFAIKYVDVGSNGNAGNTFIFYDCFELVPKNGVIGDASIEVPNTKLLCGTQIKAESKLYYTNGYLVGAEQNPGAKFTSSNPEVATVEADGTITAVKPGIATITAEYTASSSASTNVIVYDKSGIVPLSTKYDAESGEATIELTRVTDGYDTPTVIFSAYDEGDITLKTVEIEENTNIERGKITTLKKTVNGENVKAYVWNSVSGMAPVIPAVEVYSAKKDKFSEYVDFTVDVEERREPVILHLADTQIIDSAQKRYSSRIDADATAFWATDKMDELCFDYLKEVVAETNPDLILLTGDIVYGEFDDNGSALTKLIDAMESLDTPWAPIYGNHDNESNLGVNWQSAKLEAAPNCLFKQRTLSGNGNYSVGITQGGELKRVFFMLDSNGGANKSSKTMANGHSLTTTGFAQDQVDWYTEAAEKINGAYSGMKYSMVYHIPQYIFNHGYLKYSSLETPVDIATVQDTVDKAPGTDFGYIGKTLGNGWNTNLNVYRGAKALGFDSHFVGHEHAQSASITHDGTLLQFGQKSSAYDSLNWKDSNGNVVNGYCLTNATPMVGGTVLKMNEDGSFGERYISYCDGVIDAE